MAQSLKALLYRYLFALSPKKVQQMYFQGKTLVPKEELLKAYSHAVISLKKKGNLGDYLEFGVFKGDSLACMYKVLKQEGLDSVRLFGFDSFEGLPDITDAHDKSLPWQKGEFVSTIETTKKNLDKEGVDWNRTFLIKGFLVQI